LPAAVQRLLAHPIARHAQYALASVPQREREHADALAERGRDPPALDAGKQRLRVGMTAPRRAGTVQFGTELRVIVDFAVEDDDVAARRRMHWRMSVGRQVDDGQTPM